MRAQVRGGRENRYCGWCLSTRSHVIRFVDGVCTWSCVRCGSVKWLVDGREVGCHQVNLGKVGVHG